LAATDLTLLRVFDETHPAVEEDGGAISLLLLGYTFAMPRGRPSPKMAITVDPEVHAGVIAAAAADGLSVSAWMTEAARRALVMRDGLAAVQEWESRHGAFTTEELDAARRRLTARVRRTRRSA
jgi:hypothetical protein